MVGGGGWRPTLGEWTWCHSLGAIAGCSCGVLWWGEGDDQLWGSGRSIAGCPWHPTQQWHPEKASRKAAFSFLQTLHCSLHWWHKNWFLLSGVYAGIIFTVAIFVGEVVGKPTHACGGFCGACGCCCWWWRWGLWLLWCLHRKNSIVQRAQSYPHIPIKLVKFSHFNRAPSEKSHVHIQSLQKFQNGFPPEAFRRCCLEACACLDRHLGRAMASTTPGRSWSGIAGSIYGLWYRGMVAPRGVLVALLESTWDLLQMLRKFLVLFVFHMRQTWQILSCRVYWLFFKFQEERGCGFLDASALGWLLFELLV